MSQVIGDCDAYVMCASDEFIERGGYATQELAWALARDRPRQRLRYFVAVVQPETVLPSAIAGWPRVIFAGGDERALAQSLEMALTGEVFVLAQNAIRVAVVGAEVGWYSSRSRAFASQAMEARGGLEPLTVEVYWAPYGTGSGVAAVTDADLTIGIVSGTEAPALQLSWKEYRFGTSGMTESSIPIPESGYLATNLRNS